MSNRVVGRIIKHRTATVKVIERDSHFGRAGYFIEILSGYLTSGGERVYAPEVRHAPRWWVHNRLK